MITIRSTIQYALVLWLIGGMGAAWAGTLAGTITYKGKPRPPRTVQMSADPFCAANHGDAKDEKFVVGEGNGDIYPLANIFVYVKSGHAKKAYPAPSQPLVIDQKECTYVPHVAGAMVGQKIEFKNSDQTMHNVHSLSKESDPFNRGMPAGSPNAATEFKAVEVMAKFKCDAHPWMSCYIGVLDHPFFAVTGLDGKFTIEGLEDGQYEVEAWQELLGLRTGTATVKDGKGTLEIQFTRER